MSLRMSHASCFAQGAWNIYILQPDWLNRKGVWVDPKPLLIESMRSGPGFRYSSENDGTRWTITPFRVVIDSPGDIGQTAPILARLLMALPETPIYSFGSQFNYRIATHELGPVFNDYQAKKSQHFVEGQSIAFLAVVDDVSYTLELSTHYHDKWADLTATATPILPKDSVGGDLADQMDAFKNHRPTIEQLALQYWEVSTDENGTIESPQH